MLPEFVPPMLAQKGRPFDSEEHLFEIKWDGTRAQARLPGDGSEAVLTNRRQRDLTVRYPEFSFLGDLETGGGAILDGEIVVMRDGKPDFGLLLTREQVRKDLRIQSLSRSLPATYVVFDLLYLEGRSILTEPLSRRRDLLSEFVAGVDEPGLALSDGIVGDGRSYFAAAVEQQLEGVMAKRLSSPYEPGRRTDAWQKIKQKHTMQCAIVGFVAEGEDIRSLILAGQLEGAKDTRLRCVGKVGSGLTSKMRDRLAELLFSRLRDTPWIACEEDGLWVEPGLYCTVSYLESTRAGHLRAPVFLDLIVDE